MQEKNSNQKNFRSEIKLRIKTLKSDLAEKSGEELFVNLKKEVAPAKEIKLPPTEIPPAATYGNVPTEQLQKDASAKQIAKQKTATPPVIKFENHKNKTGLSFGLKFLYFTPVVVILVIAGLWLYQQIQNKKTVKNTMEQPPTRAIKQEAGLIFAPPQTATATILTTSIASPTKSETATTTLPIITSTITGKQAITQDEKTAAQKEEPITIEEPKSPKIYEPIEGTQKEIKPTQTKANELWSFGLPSLNVEIQDLNKEGFQKAWQQSLKRQKGAGTLSSVNFAFSAKRLPTDFIIDYFINPTFIAEKFRENFKNSIGPNYEIMYYFTHTRKFPLLVLEINDDLTAIPFLKLWDKESILSDFSNIYYGLSNGRFIRQYLVTRDFKGLDYRIAFRDDDYKFLWSVYNNKLIVSTTVSGFQILLDKLKALE